jgi:hypothetical protein
LSAIFVHREFPNCRTSGQAFLSQKTLVGCRNFQQGVFNSATLFPTKTTFISVYSQCVVYVSVV